MKDKIIFILLILLFCSSCCYTIKDIEKAYEEGKQEGICNTIDSIRDFEYSCFSDGTPGWHCDGRCEYELNNFIDPMWENCPSNEDPIGHKIYMWGLKKKYGRNK